MNKKLKILIKIILLILIILIIILMINNRPDQESEDFSNSQDTQDQDIEDIELAILDFEEASTVEVKSNTQNWNNAQDGQYLDKDNCVKTSEDSSASIIFEDNHAIRLDENTEICLLDIIYSDEEAKINIQQIIGNTWSRIQSLSDKEVSYEVESETIIATVRGTAFNFEVNDEKQSIVDVTDNNVELSAFEIDPQTNQKNKFAKLALKKGYRMSMDKNKLQDLKNKRIELKEEMTPNNVFDKPWIKRNQIKDELMKEMLNKAKDNPRHIIENRLDLRPRINQIDENFNFLDRKRLELFIFENKLGHLPEVKEFLEKMNNLERSDDPDLTKKFLAENVDLLIKILRNVKNIDPNLIERLMNFQKKNSEPTMFRVAPPELRIIPASQ